MSDEKNAGSKLYYPDELQFQKNSEFAILNYDRVVAGQDEGESQTAFLTKPNNKVLFELERAIFTGKSPTQGFPYAARSRFEVFPQ